jgi:hypothetical protein
MQLPNAFATATIAITLLLSPLAAQQVLRYSNAEQARSGDAATHALILTLRDNGRVGSAELHVDGGSPGAGYRVALEVRTGGRRVVLQGRHAERGLITVAGTRAEDEFRGTIQVNEQPTKSIHLSRVDN